MEGQIYPPPAILFAEGAAPSYEVTPKRRIVAQANDAKVAQEHLTKQTPAKMVRGGNVR